MPDATSTLLNWHRDRRAQGVPTVSTLVGPAGLGSRAWREWAAARAVIATTSCRLDEIASAWSAAALAADLPAAAARWLRRETATAFDPAATRHDLDELRRKCHGETSDPTVAVPFRLLHAAAAGRELRADEFVASVADPAQLVAGVCGLYPDAAWPTLLVTPAADDFAQAARSLERLAVAAPRLPVGVCVTAGAFARFAADSSRALALAREGARYGVEGAASIIAAAFGQNLGDRNVEYFENGDLKWTDGANADSLGSVEVRGIRQRYYEWYQQIKVIDPRLVRRWDPMPQFCDPVGGRGQQPDWEARQRGLDYEHGLRERAKLGDAPGLPSPEELLRSIEAEATFELQRKSRALASAEAVRRFLGMQDPEEVARRLGKAWREDDLGGFLEAVFLPGGAFDIIIMGPRGRRQGRERGSADIRAAPPVGRSDRANASRPTRSV